MVYKVDFIEFENICVKACLVNTDDNKVICINTSIECDRFDDIIEKGLEFFRESPDVDLHFMY